MSIASFAFAAVKPKLGDYANEVTDTAVPGLHLNVFAPRTNRAMPTTERRDFVLRKARDSFRTHRAASPTEAAAAVEHGEIMCV